ncbi:MAG TPA: metal-sensitive transcriptional regulator [Firmicutes bacterium]|nr:metal-sensitive transcriptional regulator [Bacillota bacterium]
MDEEMKEARQRKKPAVQCNKKDIDNRLATIEGHIRGVRQMLAEGKSCEEILLQLYAISGSLRKLSKKVLYDHLNNCVKDSIQKGETDVLESFADILEKYI